MVAKIKELDRKVVEKLSVELEEVIAKTLEKYGLDVSHKRGNFGFSSVDLTFEIVVPEAHEEQLNAIGNMYGAEFKIGDEYSDHKGTTYRVTGFNPKAHKNTVQVTRLFDNGKYKTSIRNVNSLMRFEKAKAKGKVSGNEWRKN